MTDRTQHRPEEHETLGDIFRRTAYAQLPSRFHQGVQLLVPLAVQLAMAGWYRTAGWLLVASAFSLWAIAQQRLTGYVDAYPPDLAPAAQRWWGRLRKVTAGAGMLLATILVAETFAQFLAGIFGCPGCAG